MGRLLPRCLLAGLLLLLLWVVKHLVCCAADLSGLGIQALQGQQFKLSILYCLDSDVNHSHTSPSLMQALTLLLITGMPQRT